MTEQLGWLEPYLAEGQDIQPKLGTLLIAIAATASFNPLTNAEPSQAWALRENDRALTEEQVYQFRKEYAYGQSPKAMYSRLGYPARSEGNRDVWRIQRIGLDGSPTGEYGEFVAEYNGDRAEMWRAEW